MLYRERARAESFGAVAQLYDRTRPSYPSQLIDALLADALAGEPPPRVLDVGCGTGIAGELFARRGCDVLGVEIDERMARLARARGLTVEVASFERWDARGRQFDLAICAQAWHWIDPVAGAAKAAMVLIAGGRLGLIWNFGDPPAAITELLAPIYARLAPGLEQYSVLLGNLDARARASVEGITDAGGFVAADVSSFRWSRRYQTAEWLALLQTHSDHHKLPAQQRKHLLEAIGEALDSVGGSFEMPYDTVLVSARRR